jgi:multisubunit Na+/H+ antiporter MnhC subunit
VAVVEWLQHFLLRESNNRRLAYGLAIAGHVIIALLLLHGFFERTEPASVATMPVEIVMEEPAAASPPPVSAPNEQNGLSKQPGHDGGDPSSAALPMPPAAGDLASGAASLPSWAVEPIGLAQRQATAHELGEDELTAIKEPKLECGAKARGPLPRARMTRQQALVIGTATAAQALAMIRSTQVRVDRHINPNYATNTEVFADTWEGKTAVVLPAGLTVNVGEMIEFDEGHVDPSNPCQYIPNLAVSKR